MKYFIGSYFLTIIGLIAACFWGGHVARGGGLTAVFIAIILSILEVSLSFDNAVVNAMKLEKMSEKWRGRFLTWGIAIAVFGMRFVFPVLIVSIFAKLGFCEVVRVAVSDAAQYAHYLHEVHAPIVAFGGTFLMMLFLAYFFDTQKDVHWFNFIEQKCQKAGNINGLEVVLTILSLMAANHYIAPEKQLAVLCSGLAGIVCFLLIDGVAHWLEEKEVAKAADVENAVKCTGFVGFMYLELIDASFSLDGVLGAFALSTDIVIITIGLSIGAMFVRSLTIYFVEKKTLAQFRYLEHGAHWAIGALAVIMLVSTFHEVSEVVTGLIGAGFIFAAYISSVVHNKKAK